MKEKKVSVIIPVYNEALNIEKIVNEIRENLEKVSKNYEIIVVDDGSQDNSWEKVKELSRGIPNLRGIRFNRNFGKECAIMAGLEHAKGDAVIVMDADGQHPPALIGEMVKLWKEKNVDVVEGVKKEREKESLFKKIGVYIFYKMMKILSGLKLEGKSDFKLLDKKVVEHLINLKERNLFFRGISEWMGFKKAEIYFTPGKRKDGKSKWSFMRIFKYAIRNITSFSTIPLHFVTLMGIIFLIFSLILGVQTLYMKLSGKSVAGFTTVILLILITGSLLMISLGIIGEYIARIYEEVKERPRYIVREFLNFDK